MSPESDPGPAESAYMRAGMGEEEGGEEGALCAAILCPHNNSSSSPSFW